MHKNIRNPAVAGLFYPASSNECGELVARLLLENPCENKFSGIKALVVPHAGYIYSGAVAANAFNQLVGSSKQASSSEKIKKVLLLGPSHRVPLRGMAFSKFSHFRTPLGDIPLAIEAMKSLADQLPIEFNEAPHEFEHSLEVELPFLQQVLGEFSLIPIVVGLTSDETVAALIKTYWNKSDTLIVVSSDLSHFLSYDEAQAVDAETTRQILEKSSDIKGDQACGCYPLNGLLLEARRQGADVDCVALANSGDMAGDKDSVVGYGAYVIH